MTTLHLLQKLLAGVILLSFTSICMADNITNPTVETIDYEAPYYKAKVTANGASITNYGFVMRYTSTGNDKEKTYNDITPDANGIYSINVKDKLGSGTYYLRAMIRYGTSSSIKESVSQMITVTIPDTDQPRCIIGNTLKRDTVSFTSPAQNTAVSKTLFLQIDNLIGDIIPTITPKSGTGNTVFTISPSTLTKESLTAGTTITITYGGTNKNANATLALGNLSDLGIGNTTLILAEWNL